MNAYFTVFGRNIPYYGLLFTLALVLGGGIAVLHCKKRNIEKFDMVCSACFAGIGGIIGAKLLSILTSIKYIIQFKPSFIDVISNGFVFYGGIIGGFFGVLTYCKIYKLSLLDFFDVFAICVPICHAIGRVGCFISGCCYGIPYNGVISVTYTNPVDINTPIGVPLLPIQLIESACLIFLYIALEILFFKVPKKGVITCTYLIAYSVIRTTLEFYRGDVARGLLLGISTSQIISIIIVFIVIGTLIYNFVKNKKRE